MMKGHIWWCFAILAVTGRVCLAAPEPAIVQGPDEWTIDVTFEHPQQITLQVAGDKKPSRFWYTIITLTNQTNRDVDFYPECKLMTDTFEIIPAGKGVSAAVFEQVKRRHQSKYQFLEYLEGVDNKILQGEDNAKDIAIIWQDFDAKAKGVKLFITGLSNETVVINHPTEKDEAGEPLKVYLRKTLELSYKIQGDAAFRSEAELIYEGKRWVMR
ncbi:MAG: hypothetical protein JSV82_02750 [Planctomycetota bacterium]|nr:MAG: hypothetical protein JSV82_02750 [Planctomycetota bacterium]